MASLNNQDYEVFDDGSERLALSQVTEKLQSFIEKYGKQLHEIENALDETLSEVWDSTLAPIQLNAQPYEQTNILQLIRTDNKVFNKIITVFASLCLEIQQLQTQAKDTLYAPLKLLGEKVGNGVEESGVLASEGDAQIQFGKLFPFLQDLSLFVDRVYAITKNVIHQLASLYNNQQKLYHTSFKNIHLVSVFDHLSNLFNVLITLDGIAQSTDAWQNSANLYKRMIKAIKNEPAKYNVDEEKLFNIERILFALKSKLLDGRIFQNCIEQEFDDPGVLNVTQNKEFKAEFFHNLKTLFTSFSGRLVEENETSQKHKFVGICALYGFYITVFRDFTDKKFFKGIWDMHKRVPLVHLFADVAWFPNQFFKGCIPMMLKLVSNPDASVASANRDYTALLDKNLKIRIKAAYIHTGLWMVRMESSLANKNEYGVNRIIDARIRLITDGLRLAYQIGNIFKEIVNLHKHLSIPFAKTQVRYLCRCLELLKGIQATFYRRSTMIGQTISVMVQQIQFEIQKMLNPIKNRIENLGKKHTEGTLDILAALTLALSMLNGNATKERRAILKLAVHVVMQLDLLKDEDVERISFLLFDLDLVSDFQEYLAQACDCSFAFWTRSMFSIYLSDLYAHPQNASKLQNMIAVLRDAAPMLNKAIHDDPKNFLDSYKIEVHSAIKKCIIDPLCKDIEEELRYHIHSHLGVSERNPWKTGVKDLTRFIRLKPLRFVDESIDIKAHVAHYLDTTFYNLTTVSLNNWKTYGEMRSLAEEKYGITMTEVHLPSQTLEQGIDVLEIMRNIHVFVVRYNYNINNQIFIEKNSDSKALNVINITHVANSIRTHGIGIMNTTVNFIFQFLKKKFVVFSQFLYDDYIKSRLHRDVRFFKENKDQLGNRYPIDRANQFNKEIRKLGVTDQKTYLDQFRNLITEIGNVMGYIRMIRSGGFNHISNAIKFVPDLQDIISFEDLVTKEKLATETVEASKNLDRAIDSLVKNFAEGTEYFQILVSVFAEEFRSPQNSHLKNFYLIIPPLTINFVDHVLAGKDRLAKKKPGGFFTDDGFSMGIAYILKLLDQTKQFESLHWFEEVGHHYMEEQRKVDSSAGKTKEDRDTAALTKRKLWTHQKEFELLRFSMSGGSIFFREVQVQITPQEQTQANQTDAAPTPAEQAPPV